MQTKRYVQVRRYSICCYFRVGCTKQSEQLGITQNAKEEVLDWPIK